MESFYKHYWILYFLLVSTTIFHFISGNASIFMLVLLLIELLVILLTAKKAYVRYNELVKLYQQGIEMSTPDSFQKIHQDLLFKWGIFFSKKKKACITKMIKKLIEEENQNR